MTFYFIGEEEKSHSLLAMIDACSGSGSKWIICLTSRESSWGEFIEAKFRSSWCWRFFARCRSKSLDSALRGTHFQLDLVFIFTSSFDWTRLKSFMYFFFYSLSEDWDWVSWRVEFVIIFRSEVKWLGRVNNQIRNYSLITTVDILIYG